VVEVLDEEEELVEEEDDQVSQISRGTHLSENTKFKNDKS